MRVLARRLVCAVLAGALMAPGVTLAAPVTNPEAQAEVDAASDAWEVGDYETARTHIKAAYAIEQRPELLYAWATIEREAGNYRIAGGLYKAFIEQAPDSPSAGKARTFLVEMEAKAGEPIAPPEIQPAPRVEPDPEEEEEGDTTPPPPETEEGPSPLRKEKLAPVLLGVGAAVAITGGVLMGLGRSRVSDSPTAPTEDAYFSEIEVGRNVYYAGAATLGVGGLIIIGGAIRYAIVAKRGKAPRATAVVTPHGFGLSFAGRF